MDVDATLDARGKRYGDFMGHATISENIRAAYERSANWDSLAPDQRHALHMVADKIGRILNGDPNYSDSWHDICGYCTLVARRLEK